jgi:hypothetical protein
MLRKFSTVALAVLVAVAFCSMPTLSFADWDPNNPADVAKAKWIQLPDLNPTGMDVLDTIQPISPVPSQWKTLADDFICTQSGPITDAHIWGSWLNNGLPINSAGLQDPGSLQFKISFWSDVQPNAAVPYSHPGTMLWSGIFAPGQFQVNPNVIPAQEHFYDPNTGTIIGSDNAVYQYNFNNLVDANGLNFVQTVNTIYWFEVQAEVFNLPGAVPATFGWKTRDPLQHFMDDAVFADTNGFNGPNISFWRDMVYPSGHPLAGQSFDLSFVLTTPEPSTFVMAGVAGVALVAIAYRRRRTA